jgi:hypothetical protein
MKVVYFLTNGIASGDDISKRNELRQSGYKVSFSNGSLVNGFEDSCDAVVLSGDFPHIAKWAESKGVDILVEKKEPEPDPEKPKRGRKPKTENEKPAD